MTDPKKYARADAIKLLFQSRIAISLVFLVLAAIGLWLVWLENTISISIGTSLIASAIVSWSSLAIDHLRSASQLRAEAIQLSGISHVFSRRDLAEYDELVRNAREIDVVGYTLKSFTEANESYFRDRAQTSSPVRIRLLLVDPEEPWSKAMERDEGQPKNSYRGSRQAIRKKLQGLSSTVDMRLLKFPLSSMIYRIDDVLYIGPYNKSESSKTALTIRVERGGWVFEKMQKEFDKLWDAAVTDPLDLQ